MFRGVPGSGGEGVQALGFLGVKQGQQNAGFGTGQHPEEIIAFTRLGCAAQHRAAIGKDDLISLEGHFDRNRAGQAVDLTGAAEA